MTPLISSVSAVALLIATVSPACAVLTGTHFAVGSLGGLAGDQPQYVSRAVIRAFSPDTPLSIVTHTDCVGLALHEVWYLA